MALNELTQGKGSICFGEFRLDLDGRKLYRGLEAVALSQKPYWTLVFLIQNRQHVVSKEEILSKVWQEKREIGTVHQVIRQLRDVLSDDKANPRYIETVAGHGYRFIGAIGTVSEIAEAIPEELELAELPAVIPVRQRILTSPAIFGAVVFAAFVVAGIFLYASAPGDPATCEVNVRTLIVKDGQGRELWRREFAEGLNKARYEGTRICEFADLDGDGVQDVLFGFAPENWKIENDKLYGFVTRPRFLRRLFPTPARTMMFQPGAELVIGPNGDPDSNKPYDEYLGPYQVAGVFPGQADPGELRIIVSGAENNAPNQIAALDRNLNKISEYWHTGHLRLAQFAKQDGKERVFMAGVNNAYRSATLVVFDPNNIRGGADIKEDMPDRTPKFALLAAGTRHNPLPLNSSTETCRVLFERACIFKRKPYWRPFNRVSFLSVTPERIEIGVSDQVQLDSPEGAHYTLDRHLNIIEAYGSIEFRQRHWELERAGFLDHEYSPAEVKARMHIMPGCELVSPTEANASAAPHLP